MKPRTLLVLLLIPLLLGAPAARAQQTGLYTAQTTIACYLYEDEALTVKTETRVPQGGRVTLLQVLPNVAYARYGEGEGYLLRRRLTDVEPIDEASTPPYGVEVFAYYAVTADETPVFDAPEAGAQTLATLPAGTRVAFIGMQDGWARTIYHRQYGYMDVRALTDLALVSPAAELSDESTPIAVYVSFYNADETAEHNGNRILNLLRASERLTRVLGAGRTLDFNEQIGPFSRGNGYYRAIAYADGGTVLGYGGGTCQVSTALYNLALQMPGMRVLQRRSHGENGIYYAPHGQDASVGTSTLNLRIKNEYAFDLRFEAHVAGGALFLAAYRVTGEAPQGQ